MKKRTGIFLSWLVLIIIIGGAIFLNSCTDNIRAKNWGGEITITLEPGQKVVNATWKDSDLWILTRPMRSEEIPEVFYFIENSTWGVFEGKITFIESSGKSPMAELSNYVRIKNNEFDYRNPAIDHFLIE